MKVMIDTNVILDVWLAREPFWKDSAAIVAKAETREIEGWLCPTTVTTLHYIAKKALGEKRCRELLQQMLSICEVANMSHLTFTEALGSDIADFEDAVIESVSITEGIDWIATRNVRDFRASRIPAHEPSFAH